MHPLTRKRKLEDDPRPLKRPRLALPHPPPHSPDVHYSLHRRPSAPHSLLSPAADSPLSSPAATSAPASLLPPITRETLRELDLDAILRNPQLRHDLLFDPGLQFRPTSGRRKQLAAEQYWSAVAQDLDHPIRRTRPPTPPPWSDRYADYLSAAAAAAAADPSESSPRHPSRIPLLIRELIAVLTSVIIPPPPLSPAPPDARTLLAHLDPDLIAQELHRGIFDPAGLFTVLGATLKRHCAPMRDPLVDAMVLSAQPNPNVPPTPRALRAIRACFHILELMKLDIANHQLQHLRPLLAASTPEFELRTFIQRCRRPHLTRAWLRPFWPKQPSAHSPPRANIHSTLVHALTDLVFTPVPAHMRPETLYLDAARVTLLEKDAADLTALYMLLMLWRQLVYLGVPASTGRRRLEDWEVDRIKREIWQVGPRRIGSCFLGDDVPGTEAHERWTTAMQSVALQIALRAEEARVPTFAPASTSTTTTPVPPQSSLKLMQGWISTHLTRASPLATRLRALLRARVVRVVLGADEDGGGGVEVGQEGGGAGLEPLEPEIRHLAARVAKLVGVHGRVYWSLYCAEGFLGEGDAEGGEEDVDVDVEAEGGVDG